MGWQPLLTNKSIYSYDVELQGLLLLKSSTSKICQPKVKQSAMFSPLALFSTTYYSTHLFSVARSIMKFWLRIEVVTMNLLIRSIRKFRSQLYSFWWKCYRKMHQKGYLLKVHWDTVTFRIRWMLKCQKKSMRRSSKKGKTSMQR